MNGTPKIGGRYTRSADGTVAPVPAPRQSEHVEPQQKKGSKQSHPSPTTAGDVMPTNDNTQEGN